MKFSLSAQFILLLGFSYLPAALASSYPNRTIAGPFFTSVSRTQERLDMYIKADNMMTRITTQPITLSEMHQVIALLRVAGARFSEITQRYGPDTKLGRRIEMINSMSKLWMLRASYQLMDEFQGMNFKRDTNKWIVLTQRDLDRDMAHSNGHALLHIDTWSTNRRLILDKLGIFFHDAFMTDRLSLLLARVDYALCEWRDWRGQGEACSEEDDEEDSQTTPLYSTRFQRPAFLSRLRAYLRRRGEKVVVSS